MSEVGLSMSKTFELNHNQFRESENNFNVVQNAIKNVSKLYAITNKIVCH